MQIRAIICTSVATLACALAAVAALASGSLREFPRSAFLTPSGHLAKLGGGVTYQASDFPLPVRVTTPDGRWLGAQWKADSSFEHRKNTLAPFYGWVTFGLGSAKTLAGGWVTIMTPYGTTPSVAATVANMRTRGEGASYEPAASVKLAGFSGVQFDGQVDGASHFFVPFSSESGVPKWYPDRYDMAHGEPFRIIVLGVRGKTVVVYIEDYKISASRFPAFLIQAGKILGTLEFPR